MPPESQTSLHGQVGSSSISTRVESIDGAPLRIAYVTMLFPADSETFASLDVRELRRKGLDVEVHSLRPHHPDADRLARERGIGDVTCTYNGAASSGRGLAVMLARPAQAFEFLAWLLKLTASQPKEFLKSLALLPRVFDIFNDLRQRHPDVLHVYWGHYPALVGALVQKYMKGTVVSISLGAYDLVAGYPPTTPVAQRAAFVRTLGQCNVPELVDRVGVPREKVAVVFDGIDLDLARSNELSAERLPGRIVTASRLIEAKAVDEVLRAFARVHEQRPGVSLEILGDGSDRYKLERLTSRLGLSDVVTFRGHVSQVEVFSALKRAEIFLFMSRNASERLPNVLKEAMACGAVCVSTVSIGLDELIFSEDFGRVVPLGDIEGASDSIVRLLQDPPTMEDIRAKARLHVMENFDIHRTTDAYVSRWCSAVGRLKADMSSSTRP